MYSIKTGSVNSKGYALQPNIHPMRMGVGVVVLSVQPILSTGSAGEIKRHCKLKDTLYS